VMAFLAEAFFRTVTEKRAPSDRHALIALAPQHAESARITGRPLGAAGPGGAGRLVMYTAAARAELEGCAVRRRVAAIAGTDSPGAGGGEGRGRSRGRGSAAERGAGVFPGIRPDGWDRLE
jgi:hypothetical protein